MKITVQKKTDQLNFEDFLGGVTQIVTITGVRPGNAEQQWDLLIAEDKRVYRPGVTMTKLMLHLWGDDDANWIGQRIALYGDPDVMFGGKKVGGIRISHATGMPGNKRQDVALTETRGRKRVHQIEPLNDVPAPVPQPGRDWTTVLAEAAVTETVDDLRALWGREGLSSAPAEVQAAFNERVSEVKETPA